MILPPHAPRPSDVPDFHESAPAAPSCGFRRAVLACVTASVIALALAWWLASPTLAIILGTAAILLPLVICAIACARDDSGPEDEFPVSRYRKGEWE